jgi:hypothetical protein
MIRQSCRLLFSDDHIEKFRGGVCRLQEVRLVAWEDISHINSTFGSSLNSYFLFDSLIQYIEGIQVDGTGQIIRCRTERFLQEAETLLAATETGLQHRIYTWQRQRIAKTLTQRGKNSTRCDASTGTRRKRRM